MWIARGFAAIAMALTFVWSFWIQKLTIGYVAESRNGMSQVVAGSNPGVVILSVFGVACFFFLMRTRVRVTEGRVAPLQLRVVAFILDLWFLIFVIGGIGSLPSLFLEAQRTGTFQWHFERNYSVPTDNIAVPLIFVFLALMVLYFVMPIAKGRQTIGCWICGLITVSGDGSVLNLPISTATWRVYKEFTGIVHFIRTIKETDSQGRTWYDRETGLMVVRY